jgi:hypothetical protein
MNRKSIHVEGGEGSEFEDTFYTTMPESKACTNAEKELELMSEASKAHLKEIECMPTFASQGRNFEVGQSSCMNKGSHPFVPMAFQRYPSPAKTPCGVTMQVAGTHIGTSLRWMLANLLLFRGSWSSRPFKLGPNLSVRPPLFILSTMTTNSSWNSGIQTGSPLGSTNIRFLVSGDASAWRSTSTC